MQRQATTTLPTPNIYDHCLIANQLKKLFNCDTKTESDTGYVITKHIGQLREELETINKNNIPELSFNYLSGMEHSVTDAGFRYALVYRHNTPVLFVYFQLSALSSKNFKLEKNTGFVKGIVRFFLDLKKVKVLISGNALRNEVPCCCYNEGFLSEKEAVQLIVSVAEKIADNEDATALILKDIPMPRGLKNWITELGFETPWDDKVMVLDIDSQWTSLAQYIAALSRKYKTRANKIIAAGAALSVTPLTQEMTEQYEDRISELFANVASNQSFVLTGLNKNHFTLLKNIYKDNFEIIGFFEGNELHAFYTAFVTNDSYELYYAGVNYVTNNQFQLYFNILFSGLERAMLLKKQMLKLGRTSFDAKASLGAKPREMSYLVKTSNIPTLVTNWFANYFSAMEDGKWKLRNPLTSERAKVAG